MTHRKKSHANNRDAVLNCYDRSSIRKQPTKKLDFTSINAAAINTLPALLARWLPDGIYQGQEYTARNPNRADHNHGSFKVNIRTGRWADFATGDKGGDVISLAAYLSGKSQIDAAHDLAAMLGIEVHHG